MSAYSLLCKNKGKHMIFGVQEMKYFYAITYFDSKCNFFSRPLYISKTAIGFLNNWYSSKPTAEFNSKIYPKKGSGFCNS